MTTHLPESGEQPPMTFGSPDRAAGAAATEAPPLPARTTDYRLRGLDLDAQVFAEAPARAVRKPRRGRRRRHLIQFVVVLGVIVLVAAALRAWVVEPYTVSSSSMAPTLRAGTEVLVMRPGLLAGPIERGDIVVVDKPAGVTCNPGGDRSDRLVERVIAVPGETIGSVRGRIFIDGHRFEEPGWYDARYGETGPVDIAATKVPPKSYFVMGDNRHDGCDSRAFGAIPQSSVVGKVVATVARDGHGYVHLM
jgi:signal peptidase I